MYLLFLCLARCVICMSVCLCFGGDQKLQILMALPQSLSTIFDEACQCVSEITIIAGYKIVL